MFQHDSFWPFSDQPLILAKNDIYTFFRLACWLSGAEISSRNLEHPLNGKTFSDGGQTRFGMKVNAVAWQFFGPIPSRIPALTDVLAKNVIYAFFQIGLLAIGC